MSTGAINQRNYAKKKIVLKKISKIHKRAPVSESFLLQG